MTKNRGKVAQHFKDYHDWKDEYLDKELGGATPISKLSGNVIYGIIGPILHERHKSIHSIVCTHKGSTFRFYITFKDGVIIVPYVYAVISNYKKGFTDWSKTNRPKLTFSTCEEACTKILKNLYNNVCVSYDTNKYETINI